RRLRIALSLVLLFASVLGAVLAVRFTRDWLEAERMKMKAESRETPAQAARRLLIEAFSLYESGRIDEALPKVREARATWSEVEGGEAFLARIESMRRIRAVHGEGDLERSGTLVQEHLDRFPKDPLAAVHAEKVSLLTMIWECVRAGDWEGAWGTTSALLELDLNDPQGTRIRDRIRAVLEVLSREEEGDLFGAISRYTGMPVWPPPVPRPVESLRDRLWNQAETDVKRLLEAKKLPEARNVALCFVRAAPEDMKAQEVLEEVEILFDQFSGLVAEGDGKFRNREYAMAIQRYELALEFGRTEALEANLRRARLEWAMERGQTAEANARFEEAISHYGEALKLAPGSEGIETCIRNARRRQAAALVEEAANLVLRGRLGSARGKLLEAKAAWPDEGPVPGISDVRKEISRREATPQGMQYIPKRAYPVGPGGIAMEVGPLYLGLHEVTNAMFKVFIDAGGYEKRALWHPEGWKRRDTFRDKLNQAFGPSHWSQGTFPSGTGNHPVCCISWYEADAYARWAGGRLPDRNEWMVAASWSAETGRVVSFPWGDRWNPGAANIGTLEGESPLVSVKTYPRDRSPLGFYDMAGNVSEWTSSAVPNREGFHLVKGGSTHHATEYQVRLANDSFAATPDLRLEIIGFRLARPAEGVSGNGGK
ncbi:MAG: SUMF1/EgtB/PvdO family nonheme iron enzyme, partial [Planctomycetota bacterium]